MNLGTWQCQVSTGKQPSKPHLALAADKPTVAKEAADPEPEKSPFDTTALPVGSQAGCGQFGPCLSVHECDLTLVRSCEGQRLAETKNKCFLACVAGHIDNAVFLGDSGGCMKKMFRADQTHPPRGGRV